MDSNAVRDYYDRIAAVDIGAVARRLLEDRLTAEHGHTLRFDCPHHASQSKTSLIVDTEKQAFWCKGCDVGGDVLHFVEFVQSGHVTSHHKGPMPDTHRQARDYLASLQGLPPLTEFGLSPEEQQKAEARRQEADAVFAVLTDAAEHYHQKLLANAEALAWLTEHYAISRETIERFKIGFADNTGLVDRYLVIEKNHDRKVIDRTGLYVQAKDDQFHPFFRQRIVFPYWKQGRVVYMIGRKTPLTPAKDYEKAKYKKLPTHSARRPYISPAIQNDIFYNEDCLATGPSEVVITEGVTDCIALAERGIPTVSPVTVTFRDQDHEKLLALVRGVQRVYICQDNEVSGVGLAGALKTASYLSRSGVDVRLVELPLGARQEQARAQLAELGIHAGMDAKALDAAKEALDEAQRKQAEQLLADAKIDVNEYFLTASAEDFRGLTAEALPPVHRQIKQLDPHPPNDRERNEHLKPVIRAVAELDPLDQAGCVALLQEHYGGPRNLPKKLLDDSIRHAARTGEAQRRRAVAAATGDESLYCWKHAVLAIRDDRVVELREWEGEGAQRLTREVPISNFRLTIEEERIVDHGVGTPTSQVKGTIHVHGGGRFAFAMASEDFYSSHLLARCLGGIAGPLLEFETIDLERIRNTCVHFAEFPRTTFLQCFGPHPEWGYVTPSVIIKDGEIRPNDSGELRCELAHIENKSVRRLDLAVASPEEVALVGRHILEELFALAPIHISRCLAAHTFLAPVYHRLRTRYNPYILFCSGVTGKGKTSVAQLYQNFFGRFDDKGTLVAWGNTPKRIEKAGFYFNGALFVTDDFKKANIGRYQWNDARRILQGYADGNERGRLKRNAEFKEGEMIRGMLLVTGEDLPEGEASNLARMIEVSFDSNRYTPEHSGTYARCLARQHLYRGLMAHYVAWTQRIPDEQLDGLVASYYQRLDAALGSAQMENRPRILQNFALMLTGLNLFFGFVEDRGVVGPAEAEQYVVEHSQWALSAIGETGEMVRGERASVIFIEVLRSLLATRRLSLAAVHLTGAGRFSFKAEEGMANVVGYRYDDGTYIIRDVAVKEVSEYLHRGGRDLAYSVRGISSQLLADELILPSETSGPSRTTWRLRINGERVSCYRMAQGVLGDVDHEHRLFG